VTEDRKKRRNPAGHVRPAQPDLIIIRTVSWLRGLFIRGRQELERFQRMKETWTSSWPDRGRG